MENGIIPDWPAPGHVKALFTTRNGGVSENTHGAYASFNLGMHVRDNLEHVAENRALLRHYLPAEPKWLEQVHGTQHVWAEQATDRPQADAALTRQPDTVCAVMVADCLPVLLCDDTGAVVGVAHGGWRGLAAGIIEQTVTAMQARPDKLMAWLGPAIGPAYFEVGDDVREVFVAEDAQAGQAFKPATRKNTSTGRKWFADIFQLARFRLRTAGVRKIYGGGMCTYSDSSRFYSYRRDGATGRMAALIWMENRSA